MTQEQSTTKVESPENGGVVDTGKRGTNEILANGTPEEKEALRLKYERDPHAHVDVYKQYVADTPLREAIALNQAERTQADVEHLDNFNANSNTRMEQRMNDLLDIAKTEATSLAESYVAILRNTSVEDRESRIQVLAGKSPTYLASNSLRKLAEDLAQPDPAQPVDESKLAKEFASERSRYLDEIKKLVANENLDTTFVDILASNDDQTTKASKIKSLF